MNMKIQKYILVVGMLIFLLPSCDDGFEELNKHPFEPTTASMPPVFNNMVSTMMKGWQEQTGLEYELMGLASQVTNIYGISGYLPANSSSEIWVNYYRYLSNSRLYDRMVAEYSGTLDLVNLIHQKNIVHAYKTFKMVDYFGDIPYYNAGRTSEGSEYFYPEYDDQKKIYLEMMQMLKDADAALVESPGEQYAKFGNYDVLLGDNILHWRKLANSIRLRQALRAYDADNSLASHVSDIIDGNLPLLEEGEDVEFDPKDLPGLDLRGRIWAYSGGKVRFGTSLFESMSDGLDDTDIFDPRLRLFAETNSSGKWAPMPYVGTITPETGDPNSEGRWNNPSGIGDYHYSPINYWLLTGRYSVAELVFTAAEVHFLKAEAYAKGVGVAANMAKAKKEYEAGIRSSIAYWFKVANDSKNVGDNYSWQNVPATPQESDIVAMLANPKVAWDDSRALDLIYTQRWISHFRQVPQSWHLWRQTKKTPHQGPEFVFNRVIYPQSEQDNNTANYNAQVSKMGADDNNVKVWWMK